MVQELIKAFSHNTEVRCLQEHPYHKMTLNISSKELTRYKKLEQIRILTKLNLKVN